MNIRRVAIGGMRNILKSIDFECAAMNSGIRLVLGYVIGIGIESWIREDGLSM